MIWVFVILLTGIVWLFIGSLYIVSEISVPDHTHDFCRKLNRAVLFEWVSQLVYSFLLLATGYSWFGIVLMQVSWWHALRHLQDGPPFTAYEVHRPKFRQDKQRFYTFKLLAYALVFLVICFNAGVYLLDVFLQHPIRRLWSAYG